MDKINKDLTEDQKKISRKSLRQSAQRLEGKIQNYIGDWITNYELVKKGYSQPPVGMFAEEYNYDNFNSLEDIQKAVLDDLEYNVTMDGLINNKLSKNQESFDSHISGEGAPGVGDPLGSLPSEDELRSLSIDEIIEMLNNSISSEGIEMNQAEAADLRSAQNILDKLINEMLNDPNISDEKKEALREALENSKKSGNANIDEKIDEAMKETSEDDDMLDKDERNLLTKEKVDERIREMEEKLKIEEEETNKRLEELKEERMKEALKNANGSGNIKSKPISWKLILKKMIPKPIEVEEESITKMHNRTKSNLAIALNSKSNDGISIKPGTIIDEETSQKLIFVLDSSGSMSEVINGVNKDILNVIEKSKKNGIEDMYIIKFDSDWDIYKIDLDKRGKKHKVRQFKRNYDVVKKTELLNTKEVNTLLKKEKFPIETLFASSWGRGTIFPVEMSKILLKLISKKNSNFNCVMFTDSDILNDDNMIVLKKITNQSKKPFSFNIILDTEKTYNIVKKKLSGYKYVTYLTQDINNIK